MQVSEACERCVSGKIDDHEVGGDVEDLDVRDREGGEDRRIVEHVGLVGNMSREVKEQMKMRTNEIGENNQNIKAKVVFYTFNKAEKTRGGHKEMYVPIGCRSRQWQ